MMGLHRVALFLLTAVLHLGSPGKIVGISTSGDIILGGLFPVHDKGVGENKCGLINAERGLQRLEAMRFAVQEINNSTKILNNIDLGVKILDTCSDATHALDQSLDFVMSSLAMSQTECESAKTTSPQTIVKKDTDLVMAVIGAAYSSVSIQVANLLRLFQIPQISYASTSAELSQKDRFGYFMRTVPPDKLQAKALVDIVQYFNWSYVSTIASEGEYGDSGIESFRRQFQKTGQCIAVSERIKSNAPHDEYKKIVNKLYKFKKARVVILFVRQDDVGGILKAATELGYEDDFIWLASDGWGNGLKPVMDNEKAASGSLTITLQSQTIQKFDDYFLGLTPENNGDNIWFGEYWENLFSCVILNNSAEHPAVTAMPGSTVEDSRPCTMRESLTKFKQESKIQFVYDAVYAVAYALDRVYREVCGENAQGICEQMRTNATLRTALLKYIKENKKDDPQGNAIRFDNNGDSLGYYNIMNYRRLNEQSQLYEYAVVGSWENNALSIEDGVIKWPGPSLNKAPLSICSLECLPGHRKEMKDEDLCCWHCLPCEVHEFLESEFICKACSSGYWPTENKTGCLKLDLQYMKWTSSFAIVPATLSILGFVCTVVVMYIFITKKETPIVKAAGRELSFLLFAGCLLCYIAAFVVLIKPSMVSCAIQRLTVGAGFAIIYSALLTKTNRIYRIFKSARKTTKRPAFTSPRSQLVIASLLVSGQLVLSTVWFIVEPIGTRTDIPNPNDRSYVVLKCAMKDSSVPIYLSYNMLLIIICTIYAILARKIPSNFNESKFIGFTMYTTCIIWLSFVPIYFGLKQSYEIQTTTLCTAIVMSATIALFCLFGPKCYIIIFHPEKNRRRTTRDRNRFSYSTKGFTYKGTEERGDAYPETKKAHKLSNKSNEEGSHAKEEGKLSLLNEARDIIPEDDQEVLHMHTLSNDQHADPEENRSSKSTDDHSETYVEITPEDSGHSDEHLTSSAEDSYKEDTDHCRNISQDTIGIENLKPEPQKSLKLVELTNTWDYIDNMSSSATTPITPSHTQVDSGIGINGEGEVKSMNSNTNMSDTWDETADDANRFIR